ncbi:hypothetical protein PPSIR1_32342 [Plesiocystis pacifica SIR-1]|uniref:Uncharacterized protein n=1 Tax=Plesiocystis pacifica SIR-1 TaxID=391625 RepID=A6G5K4_9BACT|nr:hypothetical protein [Plesiocystis pacifica]EDM78785.1 hypothetical protein PPSIR1_32342 [Plesiocystis pacifica SIR-1]
MSERQLWVRACVGSVVVHALFALGASLLPDGSRAGGATQQDELFTPGAVIPIEISAPVASLAVDEPASLPRTESEELPARAPEEQPPSDSPTPDAGTKAPPEPSEANPSESQAPGLALAGLRDNATASATVGSVGPDVDPSALGGSRVIYEQGVQNPGVGGGTVQGPSAPQKTGNDFTFVREGNKRVYRDPSGRFVATLRSDGRVDFRNKGAKASWTQIGLSDPGTLLSKASGEDPYARLKARLLRATFDMRLGMAQKFQLKQLDKRVARLEKDLGKLWADERRDYAKKRELLFQRWDECDEPDDLEAVDLPGFAEADTSTLDEARQKAATKARKTILKFIRKNAPKGSPQAYTPGEIADMNARRESKQPFKPY